MDLSRFADAYRGHRPAVLPGAAASISAERAWKVTVEACRPYARGTRYRALPAVSFAADGYRHPSPAALLPGDGDVGPATYLQRLGRNPTLTVTEPLFTDFPLWRSVRDLLAELWDQVGYPVQPIGSTLVLTTGPAEPLAKDHQLICGLADGDLAYVPPGGAADLGAGPHLTLRLRIPADPRSPVADAFDLVAAATQQAHYPDGAVPYFPALVGESGEVSPARAWAGPAFRPAAELTRLRQVQWASRVSAAGLEPVPEPTAAIPLTPDQQLRLTTRVVTSPETDGAERWAVNGHSFVVKGPVPRQILTALRSGRPLQVAELCADNGALPLLERLLILRAVETLETTACPAPA